MAFPAPVKFLAAGMLLNQQITFTSLNQTLSAYIGGATTFFIAQGFVCAGSSNGTTAAMDGVNRWSSTAAVRGANTTTAQSWIVITHANGAQTLFAYTGGTDDIARISGSPGGLFILAGTATFAPTATDEVVGITGVTLINSTASANRVANYQVDTAHNGWRMFMFRSSVLAAALLWGELFDPTYLISPASCAVPVWWGTMNTSSTSQAGGPQGAFSASSLGGSTRMVVSGVPLTVNLGGTSKILSGGFNNETNVANELNGGGFMDRAIGLCSTTTSARGDVGKRFDWRVTAELKACGEKSGDSLWINLNNTSTAGGSVGTLWTWDGTSAVQVL